jgi:hypothetical protein
VPSRDARRSARAAASAAWELRTAEEAFDLIGLLAELADPEPEGENQEAARLFREDQADRTGGDVAEGTGTRDRVRRRRGMAMLLGGQIRSARDYYHLAMLLQHGGTLEYLQLGHALARRAAAAGYRPGAWLAAAAHDRWLMHANLPQKYGTQYTLSAGRWVLYPVDPETTDAERAQWDVPPRDAALRRADELNDE